ncbi:MAG: histidine kinase dimerization/phospho-acceptor domain-containing protein, partial [Acidobacteriota bacterium]
AAVWQLELEPPQLRLTRSAFSPRAEGASSDASPGPEIPFPETLSLEELPRFTQFLADGNLVDAHEAQGDARLDELSSRWLEPRRAASVLVVPVMAGGDLCAVLWLESGPKVRVWQASDISFANEAVHLLAHATVHRQRHLLEQRLVDGQKREGLGVLAGGLAHDFNNLLVGILGGADLLDRQMAEHPEVRQRLDLIRNSARRASDLCSQMLAYAGKGRFQSA